MIYRRSGYWTIGVPVSSAIVDEDMALLKRIEVPDGIYLQSAEAVVNGQVWEWRAATIDDMMGDFGSWEATKDHGTVHFETP